MIPASAITTVEIQGEPDLTWSIQLDKNVVGAKIDDLQAVAQAIYLILNTERYTHAIYSWDYGVEFTDLFGKAKDYVYPEIKRRITEALLVVDDRITGVSDFIFTKQKGAVGVTFTVSTIYGEVEAGRVVSI